MKIENAQTTFFTSKDHYLQFVKSWKQYHAEGKHKKVEVTNNDGGGTRMESNLHCVHHLIYVLLRGKDISKMFQATDKHVGQGPYYAFEQARSSIDWRVRINRIESILEPFAGTIDKETLVAITRAIEGWSL